ncbi:MAG: tRNA 2-thiocytidine biosynthesis protein TtcA [Clostridiales bacterium]|jgi:tRNA(Ile)-lysidine synthase TilS/MesJ|nr:tRNA 2-thiocytidine biosynthesis protein TtcA [Clostridiales bacterium]
MERYKDIERSIITTYRASVWKKFISAINEYALIKDGDKIAVCISGGKDSMLMAKCFQELKKHGKNNFEAVYLVMDPGYNEINRLTIENNAKLLNIPVEIFESNIFETVANTEESPCYLCARMRRGSLYAKAKEYGCNKIALGHHFDDVTETIMMGILYNGQIQSMMPKLKSDNFEGMELIRPMYKISERDIINWRNYNDLNFIQCACRFTENCSVCDNGGGGSKRQEMKYLIKALNKKNPNAALNIFRSVYNVNLDTVIGYKKDGERHYFWEDYDSI